MPHILLIDDDDALREMFGEYLTRLGHRVSAASTGEAGITQLTADAPDIVILDVTMPGMDGWQTLELIRQSSSVPVIMLTARTEETDDPQGLRARHR